MILLTNKKKKKTLEMCPEGLFIYDGMLCMKTEYSSNGTPDCFIVASGEFLSAGGISAEEYLNLKVTPIKVNYPI